MTAQQARELSKQNLVLRKTENLKERIETILSEIDYAVEYGKDSVVTYQSQYKENNEQISQHFKNLGFEIKAYESEGGPVISIKWEDN